MQVDLMTEDYDEAPIDSPVDQRIPEWLVFIHSEGRLKVSRLNNIL